MLNDGTRGTITMMLLFFFLVVWTLTEIYERRQEKYFNEEVNQFIDRGGRFTADDGFALCQRIQHLEEQHHKTAGYCEPPDTDTLER